MYKKDVFNEGDFMKKSIFFFALLVFLPPCVQAELNTASFVVSADEDSTASIPAYLFLSNSCPWCRKLKQEGFPAKFKQKYAGEVVLKEYEIHTQEGQQQYQAMIRKHHLKGGVPMLIIGDTTVPGYSANMLSRADEAVRKERGNKKYQVKKKPVKKEENLPEVLGIAMADEDLQGVAPEKDLQQMQAYLDQMQDDNGQMLNSLNGLLSAKALNKAMSITNTYEQKIRDLATKSPSFESFKKQVKVLENAQQKQIDQLLRTNINRAHK